MIPGGSPDNPLGKYRMRLTLNLYGIHGTNIPWGVGMLVSHGCVRLYPEDIEHFFPMVPVGTQGEFVYQTVKVGTRDGRVFVEVHKDLYGTQPGPYREAVAALQRMGLLNRVDDRKLMQMVSEQSGVPMEVTRSGGAPAPAEPQQAMPAPAVRPPTQIQPAPRPPGAPVPPTSAAHRAAPAAQPKPVAARTRSSTQARSTAE
jgi:hypothetical protein